VKEGSRTINPFLFIVGCPRSGTTLFRRMVDAHPDVAVVPEVGWLARRYEERQGLTPDGLVTRAFIRRLTEKPGFGRYARIPLAHEELTELLESDCRMSYAEFVTMLFDRYGEQHGKRLVANKTVDLVRSISMLHELWPTAKFAHLIRDGRDVALSAMSWRRAEKLASRFPTWREDPMSTAAAWWEWHVRAGREDGRSIGTALYYEVRYESLVANAGTELRNLCLFLGITYDEAMVRFYEGREQNGPGLDAKHGWRRPTPGLRDWRTQMAAEDVERFEAIAGGLLDELGYARGSESPCEERLEHAVRIRHAFAAAVDAGAFAHR
jgi:Sulfotransferase family